MAASDSERLTALERRVLRVVPAEGSDAMAIAQEALARVLALEGHIHSTRCSGLTGPAIAPAAALLPEGPGETLTVPAGTAADCYVFPGGTIATPAQASLQDSTRPAPIAYFELGPGAYKVHPTMLPGWLKRKHPDIDFSGVDLMVRLWGGGSPIYWRAPADDED